MALPNEILPTEKAIFQANLSHCWFYENECWVEQEQPNDTKALLELKLLQDLETENIRCLIFLVNNSTRKRAAISNHFVHPLTLLKQQTETTLAFWVQDYVSSSIDQKPVERCLRIQFDNTQMIIPFKKTYEKLQEVMAKLHESTKEMWNKKPNGKTSTPIKTNNINIDKISYTQSQKGESIGHNSEEVSDAEEEEDEEDAEEDDDDEEEEDEDEVDEDESEDEEEEYSEDEDDDRQNEKTVNTIAKNSSTTFSSKEATVAPPTTLVDLAKKAAAEGVWKCNDCFSQNPKDAVNCKACEAPKPSATSSSKTGGWSTSSVAIPPNTGFSFASSSTKPEESTTSKPISFSFNLPSQSKEQSSTTFSFAPTSSAVVGASLFGKLETNGAKQESSNIFSASSKLDAPATTTFSFAPSSSSVLFGATTVEKSKDNMTKSSDNNTPPSSFTSKLTETGASLFGGASEKNAEKSLFSAGKKGPSTEGLFSLSTLSGALSNSTEESKVSNKSEEKSEKSDSTILASTSIPAFRTSSNNSTGSGGSKSFPVAPEQGPIFSFAASPTLKPKPFSPGNKDLTMSPRTRLTKFYEKYNPDKLAEVPNLLKKYSGKEDELFLKLRQKYPDSVNDPTLSTPTAPSKFSLSNDSTTPANSGPSTNKPSGGGGFFGSSGITFGTPSILGSTSLGSQLGTGSEPSAPQSASGSGFAFNNGGGFSSFANFGTSGGSGGFGSLAAKNSAGGGFGSFATSDGGSGFGSFATKPSVFGNPAGSS
jgi:hypothetical protein